MQRLIRDGGFEIGGMVGKKHKSKPVRHERHPADDRSLSVVAAATQGPSSQPEPGQQVSILSLDDPNETLQPQAVHDLAVALRRSEMQRFELVNLMLKLDPGELAELRQRISQLDLPSIENLLRSLSSQVEHLGAALAESRSSTVLEREIAAIRGERDQATSQLRATQTQLQQVREALLVTQRALEEHQSVLQLVYRSWRWRLVAWFDRLFGRGGASASES